MALTDKDILITPNRGQTADPKIEFKGADATLGAQTISLNVYPTDNGTVSFEGSAGQLFSITNTLSGTIYSVNDVSGIPSIEVLDTGLIKLGQYGGNILIGKSSDDGSKLQLGGGISTPTMWVNYSPSNNNSYNENIRLFAAGNGASVIAFNATGTSGSPAGAVLGYSDRIEIRSTSDSIVHRFYNNYSLAVVSSRAPIFYDSDNTAYYIDAASTSNLNGLTVAGTITGSISGNAATVTNGLYTTTNFGGDVSGTYNAIVVADDSHNHSISTISDEHRLFNNMGDNHATRTSFDATAASYNFGWRYVQGSTNGPGTSGTQFYSLYVGLGNDYPATGAGSYGMFLAIDRNVTNPYLNIRYNENNGLSAWYKIYAGRADAWTTARTLTIGSTGKSVDGTANVSWSLSEIGVGAGTLTLGIGTAGATNTTVTIGTGTGYNANTGTNTTYDLKVGPALTNLATLMTTAGAGFIRRGATADTYTIDTNTYLTAESDTLATVTGRGNTATSASIAYFGVNNTTNTNGYGISLYNGAVAGQPTYGLMFQGTATFGTHGGVTADWATYFTMNNTAGRGWVFRDVSTPANVASITNAGLATFNNSVRSPIFYDSNDTNYYVDPATATILAGYSKINLTTGSSALEDGRGVVINGSYGDGRYSSRFRKWDDGGGLPLYIQQTTGTANVWSNVASFGISNTRYHFHVDGTGYSSSDFRAPIFYDSNNTAYYADPASNSVFNTLNLSSLTVSGRFINSGYKVYNVTTPGQGNVNSTYEIMRISRDSVNWSTNIGYEVTVRSSSYNSGGVTSWYITYGYDSSGAITCIDSRGTTKHRVYLGSEVVVSGNIKYIPVYVDIPNYFTVAIEVKYNTTEVTSITGASQVYFTGTMTTGTGSLYGGDITLVPNGGNVYAASNLVLHAGNYNSYSPTLTGTGASGTWGISISGNAATATSASNIDGVAFNNSNSTNPVSAPDTLDSNGIGYVTNISLFSQTDGALYSQAYSSSWQHQIYGDYRTGQIAIRGKNNGTWQAWRSVLDSTNYTTWAATSGHNHTYNVNDAWLRDNGDDANVKLYGNSRQMAFRTDGTTEYATGVGGYPFAWMYGGDAAGNRLMLLNTSGDLWTSTNGWLSTALAGKQAAGSYLTAESDTLATVTGRGSTTTTTITADQFLSTNNGNGTNYKVGDDAWIGDINVSNTIRISGSQTAANAYIVFGNGDTTALGRAGTGALTYGGNTVWHAGNDGASSGLDADLLDGNHASAFAVSGHNHSGVYVERDEVKSFGTITVQAVAGSSVSCTTAQFISWLETQGFFDYVHSYAKCSWDYAGNNDISDTGFGANFELAGCVIETWTDNSDDVTRGNITVRITAPTTGGSGGGKILIYNDQGSGYSPGWRQVWNSTTLTNLNQLTNGPGYITGESDTLATVTGRGASTSTHTVFGPYASSVTTGNQTSIEIKNNGGSGDADVAAISFHCQNTYGAHLHLRSDSYFGVGGWSASTWRWYVQLSNGNMTAAGSVTAYSDIRLKEEIRPIESPLSKILSLNGVNFKWKNLPDIVGSPGKQDVGILAHEVEAVAPEAVAESPHISPDGDPYKTVAYDKLVPILIEAVKEQQSQIEELKSMINTLLARNKE